MEKTVEILGIPFSNMTLNETTDFLEKHLEEEQSKLLHLITINPEISITAQSDGEFRKIIKEADLITPDGIGIVLASKLKKVPIPERVTGFDLLQCLLQKGNQQGWRFYFLGTDEQTNNNAVKQIEKLYPNVSIVGRHHGFFTKAEEPLIIESIKISNPDILIVAMGAPYSDKWIYKYKDELLKIKVVFGVGGSLDVLAGKVKVTPEIWKKLNMEWFHRLITVPVAKGQKSRWLRQIAIPRFILQVLFKDR
ncbi:WecB/TagA/CpsF family glycosyltransferase [Solibacillus sp. MA9]|uniref:N-acetylglucosaminyldiphosphoundecaprenol N-acetyl-beta-D-mannosaminyltransferase n=1 Tax=Solibacillus palustris TaxID=2908203 RepID=A0ABS9UF17_9BACL|nr:WecB/TagA/CpsF family glycosyltransferase [Solibacillus sp. MA9]MCH7322725.1 WecB/TagA/CpsF family glycosyltransferase [Solibacillus sp. MA9]